MSSRSVDTLSRVISSPTRSQISRRSSGSLLSGVNVTGVCAHSRSAAQPAPSSGYPSSRRPTPE